MQTITSPQNLSTYAAGKEKVVTGKTDRNKKAPTPIIFGLHKSIIKTGMWMNTLLLALYYFKNPVTAYKAFNNLKKLRSNYRGTHPVIKYAKTGGRYYFTFNAPGWPSVAFNNYVLNNIKKNDVASNIITLDTILFGITKKCGYKCEHCFEWNTLNKPETLSRQDLLTIIQTFQKSGITQVQLSGGEPLNRFDDIVYILQNIQKGTEVWLYTSGYHFTEERAAILKLNGLTGIIVSLDHWIPELHNSFRGNKNAFYWAEKAVANAINQSLVTSLSVCTTKDFITEQNLVQYAELAKQWGVSFIQLLEPRAVGHFGGKDIFITDAQTAILDNFYLEYNYNKSYCSYPVVVYHGFYSRRVGCGGSGKHYVYVDTDGDVHNCPFCQRKVFSALYDDVATNLRLMSAGGCKTFNNSSVKSVS